MTTIKTIAKACSLSPITVSRALRSESSVSPETVERVREYAKKVGYRSNLLARNLKNGRTCTIAVIVNNFANEFVGMMLRGIQQELFCRDYQMITLEWGEKESYALDEKYLDTIIGGGAEGIIFARWGHSRELSFLSEILDRQIPVVAIDREPTSAKMPFVGTNDREGGYKAVEYLISKGHTKIGHISGPLESSPAKERLLGFYKAIAQHGLKVNQEWVLECDWRYETAEEKIVESIDRLIGNGGELPTAFFTATDSFAAFLMQSLGRHELRVPEDISVIGFTGERVSTLTNPPLTTMLQKPVEIGRKGVQLLFDALNQGMDAGSDNRRILIGTELVERSSVRSIG